MSDESSPPLPEGRADGRAEAIEQVMQRLRSMLRFGHEDAARELLVRFWPAAPVVAVPEAGEADDYTDEEYEALSEDEQNAWLARRMAAEGLAPAAPVGVQPAVGVNGQPLDGKPAVDE